MLNEASAQLIHNYSYLGLPLVILVIGVIAARFGGFLK